MVERIPRATVRASWWRRLLALFGMRAIALCHRCGYPLPRDARDADNHERLCAWVDGLANDRRWISVEDAACELEKLDDAIRDSLKTGKWRRPVPTSLPGLGESQQR